MSDLDHARLMLSAARRDLTALRAMDDPDAFADEVFGFHAQQAAEKALKAWLSLARVTYPRIHDIERLMGLLMESGQSVPGGFSPLADLTDFAVVYRYVSFEYHEAPLDRNAVVEQVRSLTAHVEGLLSRAAQG